MFFLNILSLFWLFFLKNGISIINTISSIYEKNELNILNDVTMELLIFLLVSYYLYAVPHADLLLIYQKGVYVYGKFIYGFIQYTKKLGW